MAAKYSIWMITLALAASVSARAQDSGDEWGRMQDKAKPKAKNEVVLPEKVPVPIRRPDTTGSQPAVTEAKPASTETKVETGTETPLPTPRPKFERDVSVTARALNVRTSDGQILCSVPRGTTLHAVGRHGDGERIKVKFDHPNCSTKEGFVASTYVRPEKSGEAEREGRVEASGLSLRSAPELDGDTWQCALPRNFKVTTIPGTASYKDEVAWVKVKLNSPLKGCPAEGYVAEPYLKSLDDFMDMPVVAGTEDCEDCGRNGASPKTSGQDLGGISAGIGKAIGEDGPEGPFLDGLRKMVKNRKARPAGLKVSKRGLVQIPLKGQRGPCGSFFYNASPHHIKNENRVYANPLTACVFTAVAQEWKKNFCPSFDAGCRLSFGDISMPNDPGFLGKHKSHTDGYCIDIRPTRKGGFVNGGLRWDSGGYDRAKMRKLVNLLQAAGGTNVLFNDPTIRKEEKGSVRRAGGHDNHIHVCFKDNPTTRKTCNNLTVDPNVCPELQ
jgi:hypothetical protein